MSKEMRETTTIQQWLDRLPAREELKTEAANRTNDEKQKDLDWHKELFDGCDPAQLICLIVYSVQTLFDIDAITTISLLEELHDRMENKYVFGNMPPALKQFLDTIAGVQ